MRSFNRGFTIIEVAVVLAISVILLTLTTLSLGAAEMKSRDQERRADLGMMSQCLESKYVEANSYFATINDMKNCPKSTEFMTPPKSSSISTVLATNNTTTPSGVRPVVDKSTYVFQPLTASGALCTDPSVTPCTNYNLYYFSEADSSPQKVSSNR